MWWLREVPYFASIPGRGGQDREKGHQITAESSQVKASALCLIFCFRPVHMYFMTQNSSFLTFNVSVYISLYQLDRPVRRNPTTVANILSGFFWSTSFHNCNMFIKI